MEQILKVGASKLDISPLPSMLPLELHRRLCEKYGLSKENMLITATHNHSSPFIAGPFDKPRDKKEADYIEYVISQAVSAAGLAMRAIRPAKYGFAEDKSFININRDKLFDDGYWMQADNHQGCSDKTLAALKFVDYDGNLIGAVLNYAMHSMICFGSKDTDGSYKITCDTPGIACNFVENYFGNDAVVLWQSGAAGNQNPLKPYAMTGTEGLTLVPISFRTERPTSKVWLLENSTVWMPSAH